MEEHTLIQGILEGDERSFRELVHLYQDKVYNTVFSFVHDEDDALDLSQDVFVEIHQSIARFRKESNLATWIYRIAVNKSLNHLARRKAGSFIGRLQNLFDANRQYNKNEPTDTYKQPHERLENKELAGELHRAVDSLPKNQRIAFVLHKFEDLSYKEIASVMDISLSSVESLMHRARKNLQDKLMHHYR